MEAIKALEILRPIAEGIDPHTGEMFPMGSPYQHPDTVRALYAAIKALEGRQASERRRSNLPENAGQPWSPTEDATLCEAFDSGTAISKLAEVHRRTSGAIQSRLIKLGKMELPVEQPVSSAQSE